MTTPLRLTGIGLRAPHHTEFLEKRPQVAWVEVHTENYFGEGGKSLHALESIRHDYPVSFHGVGLSLGSTDELNWQHLKKVHDLAAIVKPCLISDHLSWSSLGGRYMHDLFPLPYTDEALQHVVDRIKQIQDYLKLQILIENISNYACFTTSTMTEQDFLREVAQQSGCGILLDINNIYVSATNLNFNAEDYIAAIPGGLVQEIHVAGFSTTKMGDKEIMIDSHNHPVAPAVWDLYRTAIQQLGRKPTIVEWDTDLPALDTLCLEAHRAEKIMRETYVPTKLTG